MAQIREKDARDHLASCDGIDYGSDGRAMPCKCQTWDVIPNYVIPGAYAGR